MSPDRDDLPSLIADLPVEELRTLVASAAGRHEDVERQVRMVAARGEGDLAALRTVVDRGLRTRRFLGYRESGEWAIGGRAVAEELRMVGQAAPSQELVELLQRAVGHVVKVITHGADDSSGAIGGIAEDLLDVHACVCDAGVADPGKLARWMVKFTCVDQDFFEIDPVRYRGALGDAGLAVYRRAIERGSRAANHRSFGVQWATERLAVLDGDSDQIVAVIGGDLATASQYVRVCKALGELGRDAEVLDWAMRGIAEAPGGSQLGGLYDLACGVHEARGALLEVLALRRAHHERSPSTATYGLLRDASASVGAWQEERDAARSTLLARDRGSLVDALLNEGDAAAAWSAAHEDPTWEADLHRRLRLAEAREPDHPADALALYLHSVDEVLELTGRPAYARAVKILKRARDAATASGHEDELAADLAALRERHRRRPSLIEMLDKARLG